MSNLLTMKGVRSVLPWLVCWMVLLEGRTFCASPQISVGSPSGAPGSTVMIAVNFTTDIYVPAVSFDLTFSTNDLSSGTPLLGDALSDHIVFSSQPLAGVRRVQIFSFSDAPLTNGVLVFLPFTIATSSLDHDEALSITNISNPVVASTAGGLLAISPRPGFSSIARMNDGAIHLQLSGSGNRSYVIEATTNLSSHQWTSLETNSPVNGMLVFEDTAAGGFPIRFYRATLVR